MLQAWSPKAAPYIFPSREAPVFTVGLLPSNEASIRAFIPGVEPALEEIGISATEVIDLLGMAIREILAGRTLAKDDLGIELARWVLPKLTAHQQAAWQLPSWYAPGQSLGESVARFALPVLSLQGLCCHADRRGSQAHLARTDQWLAASPATTNHDQARAELVRRYLHCFGPSTPQHLAEWAGIAPTQAAQSWKLVKGDLLEIDYNGQKTWLYRGDLERFLSPATVEGIRFLPPHDPYLTLRDRETLVTGRTLQRRIWKHAGNPGVLLVDGRVAGIWRHRKKGNRLNITIENFTPLSKTIRSQVEAEAATVTPFWNCAVVQVEYRSTGDDLR